MSTKKDLCTFSPLCYQPMVDSHFSGFENKKLKQIKFCFRCFSVYTSLTLTVSNWSQLVTKNLFSSGEMLRYC